MKMKRMLGVCMSVLLVSLALVGCSGPTADGGESAKPENQFVTLVTGSTGGTYYPVGTIFTTLWNEKLGDTGVKASVQSSGGSVENLNMLKNEEAQLGIAMANLTLFAYEGEGKFEGNQFEDVRFVTALWPDVTQIVVTEASGIEKLEDIRGKSFNVGGAGSGTEYSSNLILDTLVGLSSEDFKSEHLGYFEASSAMQNSQLQGMNAEGGIPTSAISELAASKTSVKFIEFSDDDYNKIKEVAPYYGQFTIPAGLYSGQDEEVKTIGIKSTLICSAALDEELVYNLTKSIFDNYDEIKDDHNAIEKVTLQEAINGLPPVPLHKGAIRYYEEQGLVIPDDLKE